MWAAPSRAAVEPLASILVVVATADRQVAARVDELFQLLADLEEWEALGGDRNGLPGSRISAVVGLVGADAEAPLPADFNAFPLLKCLGHRLENAVDDELCHGLGELASGSDGFDEFALRHPGFRFPRRGPRLRNLQP